MDVSTAHTPSISDQLGSWLDTYRWTHIGTLTSGHPMSQEGWVRSFRIWTRRLENLNQKRVNYGFSIEETHSGHLHLHFVLGNVSDDLTIESIRDLWNRKGHLQSKVNLIRDGDSIRGIRYTFKGVHDSDDWDLFIRGLERRDS